jgi:hypothetical protein
MVWSGVIVAAQVADALQNAMAFTARYRGTSALVNTLDALLIDCQMEWEDIYAGRLDEAEIAKRRHAMMARRREADAKNLPGGLPVQKSCLPRRRQMPRPILVTSTKRELLNEFA